MRSNDAISETDSNGQDESIAHNCAQMQRGKNNPIECLQPGQNNVQMAD